MKITIPAFANGAMIPEPYAYGQIDAVQHTRLSDNKNPRVIWSDVPEGASSLVLICVDDKVPSVFDDANQEGKTISKHLPRTDFYHWVVVDINPERGEIVEGQDSDGVSEGGKRPGQQVYGVTGINSYSGEEVHGGYDGPCPPWNDELMHEYHFRLYAVDVSSLGLSGAFTGADTLKAMDGRILETVQWSGLYTLNPALRKN